MNESIQAHTFPVTKTAHYYTLGSQDTSIQECWIVLHGYGQKAQSFLQWFEPVAHPERLIVAPEGLSRFYWDKFSGPVVASWMTRMDRLNEIQDYCKYLEDLKTHILLQLSPNVRFNVLGFSQGCATLVRWMDDKTPTEIENLILWGGMFPEDVAYFENADFWRQAKLSTVYGNQDPFLTAERIAQHETIIEKLPKKPLQKNYEGAHTIPEKALVALFKEWSPLAARPT